jgi:hypothetical protein
MSCLGVERRAPGFLPIVEFDDAHALVVGIADYRLMPKLPQVKEG